MQECFKPKIGMVCKSSFFRGVTGREYINIKGRIEYIGTNFFQLRLENKEVLIIKDKYYWHIPLNAFVNENK